MNRHIGNNFVVCKEDASTYNPDTFLKITDVL